MPLTHYGDNDTGYVVSGFCDECFRICRMFEPAGNFGRLVKRLRSAGWAVEGSGVFCRDCIRRVAEAAKEGQRHGNGNCGPS